jgi:hypothetical protein
MRLARLAVLIGIVLLISGSRVVAQSNPVPFLNQALVPISAAPGSAGFTVTVTGSGFVSGAIAEWNGSMRLTEVISSSLLNVTIKASDLVRASTASIKVTNPAPGGGTSNVIYFPVREPFSSVAMAGSQAFAGATAVTVGDFNNDGKLDVVWGSGTTLNVSLGNGDGTFQAPIVNDTQQGVPSQIIIGDFNGDGNLDVATLESYEYVTVYLGNGQGTLTSAYETSTLSGGGSPNFIATADFNHDGHLDLYITGSDLGSQWFSIYLGKGDGTFSQSFQSNVKYYSGYGLAGIGDFNGDGKLDLAVPELGVGADIFIGNGDGTFQQFDTLVDAAQSSLAVADMNHDGKLDFVGDSGCIFLGNGDGTFTESGCGLFIGQVLGIGDFNGDGNLDATLLTSGPSAGVFLGEGNGTFEANLVFPAGTAGYYTKGGIGDFNNDGMLDLITDGGFLLLQTTAGVSPTSLAFGNQNVSAKSSPQNVTLINVSTGALAIHKISIIGSDSGDFHQANECGSSLAAGASCTITVTFAPKVGGALSASLNVTYQGVGSPQQVALSGTGIMPPTVTLTPSKLTYAMQLVGTMSAAQTATLSNTGDKVVTISGISINGPFSQTNNCSTMLGTGQTCQVQIKFQPVAVGIASGTLTVSDDAFGSPQKVALQGSGTVIELSPLSVNFGDQKVGTISSSAPITLTNLSATAVSISAINITGTDAADFLQANDCGKSVAGNGSCTINVRFKPTATGARSAALSVMVNGGGSPQTIPLFGTGT